MDAICPHCGKAFPVPPAMKGGITNCPDCRRAVDVPGRSEAAYWALLGLGAVGVLAASGVGFVLGGPAVGGSLLMLGIAAGLILAFVGQ